MRPRHVALVGIGVTVGLAAGLLPVAPLAAPEPRARARAPIQGALTKQAQTRGSEREPASSTGDDAARAEVDVEKMSCLGGLPNCLRVTNGEVEVVVTTAIGPRVIRYAFVGGENILGEMPVTLDEETRGQWQAWGGHRLWLAPEARPWSYAPDNEPIEYEETDPGTIRLMRGVEAETGMEKEIVVSLDERGTRVTLTHRLTNRGDEAVDVAAWALTIMNGGGRAILPQEPFQSHSDELLPVRAMALWGYTDLADPRWSIGPKFIQLSTDSTIEAPQKVGIGNTQGWAAYAREGTLFIKRYGYDEEATYPDFGSNTEIFTSGDFIEVETLGPLHALKPGESLEHEERWYLFRDVSVDQDEDAIAAALGPLLEQAK